jgi:plastocyanin
VLAAAAAVVGWSGAASLADSPAAPLSVGAYGNVFTGGLKFAPADVTAKVGQTVVWTNKDFLVPHTVTEDNSLWDLAGSYLGSPINPPGFAPGKTVQRVFEAGTEHYFCRVHPAQMQGVIHVPVTLAMRVVKGRKRPHHKRKVTRYVVATWAAAKPTSGEGFDVRIAKGSGAWQSFRTATTDTGGQFKIAAGTPWHVEARLRRLTDDYTATDWSPDAVLTG